MPKLIGFACLFLLATGCRAQLSSSAYRVLGQPDLYQRGVNMASGTELYAPSSIALDSRGGQVHLYISDTRNSRILGWRDMGSYDNGDPPAVILGQAGPAYTNPQGIGEKGLNAPGGLAVDPANGNLYVADYGDNRVLRFPAPFDDPTRVQPDAVYGQPNFTTITGGVSKGSMYQPRAVAFDSGRNLWVVDSGNHRILRFGAASLDNTAPEADAVIGQKDFASGSANRGGYVSASGFYMPAGLVFDAQDNLYVADYNNTRVLRFTAPLGPGNPDAAASAVWGEADLVTRGIPAQASASTIGGPMGLAIGGQGRLYVSAPYDNRVLVFQMDKPATAAVDVLGQPDFASTTANTNAAPYAAAGTLNGPADVKVDGDGNVVVADSGNHRVVLFPAGTKTATRVWGQSDFSANGANRIKPGSINMPVKMAIDYSRAPFALYVSDMSNHRVLVWKDSARFRSGAPADLAIGQPDLWTAAANVDTKSSASPSKTSLAGPAGIAVDPKDGTLYVADSGNNRVLRYPRPVDQAGRITPDAVIGQLDFTSSSYAPVSASSLHGPTGLALGPNGNLFVADTGNNRVLEFPAGSGSRSAAIRVYGQPSMASSVAPSQVSPQTLAGPDSVLVDAAHNLYVADTGANRVLVFLNTQIAPPSGAAAGFVIGQASFTATGGTGASLRSPTDVALDSGGQIYIADSGFNRVAIFPPLMSLPAYGGAVAGVVGQKNTAWTAANWDSSDGLATAQGLYDPVGVYIDRRDTLYVADAGNNRVVHFPKAAVAVHGATFQANVPLAQGGLASLFGTDLAAEAETAQAYPLPRTLAGREVVVNDEVSAPLLYFGRGQANFQIPWNTPAGAQRVGVRMSDTGELLAGGTLTAASVSPGLYGNAAGQAVALNQDYTTNSAAAPAPKGSVVTLYGTGQGPVSPPVDDAAPAPSSPLAQTVAAPTTDGKTCLSTQPSMCVAAGTAFGEVLFSGLAPGYVGIWQINVKIPQEAPAGDAVPLRVVINGMLSNTVTIAIR